MFVIPCISFKNIPSFNIASNDKSSTIQRYEVTVDISELPADLPYALSENPKQNNDSLKLDDFNAALNSGLAISALDLQYQSNTNHLTVNFSENPYLHGVINYANYKIINNFIAAGNYDKNAHLVVGIELFTGINKSFW